MFSFSCRRPLGCRAAAVATQAAVSSSLLKCSSYARNHSQQSEAVAVLSMASKAILLASGQVLLQQLLMLLARHDHIGKRQAVTSPFPALARGRIPHLPKFAGICHERLKIGRRAWGCLRL